MRRLPRTGRQHASERNDKKDGGAGLAKVMTSGAMTPERGGNVGLRSAPNIPNIPNIKGTQHIALSPPAHQTGTPPRERPTAATPTRRPRGQRLGGERGGVRVLRSPSPAELAIDADDDDADASPSSSTTAPTTRGGNTSRSLSVECFFPLEPASSSRSLPGFGSSSWSSCVRYAFTPVL